jgi:hypothetical protein
VGASLEALTNVGLVDCDADADICRRLRHMARKDDQVGFHQVEVHYNVIQCYQLLAELCGQSGGKVRPLREKFGPLK